MQLPKRPQPVQMASKDGSIVVEVNESGLPAGVVFGPAVKKLTGADLAARIMTLYTLAKTIALAVLNVEHWQQTGTWSDAWPTPAHVEILNKQLTF
ncbi:hypothetical protein [Mycobacteroides abscessus]|uniref:hypothetical protein n=2 Tax=Mycobacteroides abscessus TaxID=36809 RepID=UPI0009A74857|nr:hypothetical protein [Mycobacteroides abscessus]SKH87981.1 Uncharacterised protein [Mycobacteroides abscessus subsp. massiliense]SKH92026.1 Uncharacterised protein [Mycobacteroides abscessus subsp. massiliense]SKI12594.1 Uncharacterised protein [Mycobacteroides abscessus subsp. massiliense]SKK21677.1 Uncharacterised protein [Mycobacteroides abscessus subsp. massiliense]SKK31596.1 Uncharacterised protein [Mycobacteroides abscessus subsp. massiliense]